MVSLKK